MKKRRKIKQQPEPDAVSYDPDEGVGYGQPPKHSRFRPGQSGNPEGRPKGKKSLAELADEALNRRVTVIERGKRKRITIKELALRNLADKSATGDLKSLAFLNALVAHAESDQAAVELMSDSDNEIIRDALERVHQANKAK